MILESRAFNKNEQIPQTYTCDDKNISPPLLWRDVPAGTQSFALICDDPDAPNRTWVHWVIYNIPGDKRSLQENIPAKRLHDDGTAQGYNDFKKIGYGGPCPPSGTHHYDFKLFALDTKLSLKPGADKDHLLRAMGGHVLDKAKLTATYSAPVSKGVY
ncbi:MAG: YbhB/YbcL family Raf kinase inhibitor-like protein [Bacteroidota bacterium]